MKEDENHRNYHIIIKKFTHPRLNLNELFKIPLENIINKNTCFGRVGLKNLGNTCFMNSAIQCLSHCQDLTKYFIMKYHLKDINSNNKYGSSGQVASAYYELILNLWNGNTPNLSPGDFRQILVKIIKKFQGFSQQDSHELLTYLLDTLHEDLNRVTEKPYIEMKEKFEKESDLDGSKRFWENHLKRENSIIVDLFHGQYKSTIKCPECQRISITYDPFMYLGLPISSNRNKIYIKYFPNFFKDLKHEYINIEIPLNHNNSGFLTVKDIKLEIHHKFGVRKNNKLIIQYPVLLLCYEAVLLEKDKTFKKVLKDETEIFSYLESGNEVAIYEKYYHLEQIKHKTDYRSFYFNPVFINEQSKMLIFTKLTKINLFYPILITISVDSSLFDLYYFVFLIYRKIIPDTEKEIYLRNIELCSDYLKQNYPQESPLEESQSKIKEIDPDFSHDNDKNKYNQVKNFKEKKDQADEKFKIKTNIKKFLEIFESKSEDESYLIQEFKTFFNINDQFEINEKEVPFELFFYNTIPEPAGYSIPFYNTKPACEFCNKKNCNFCPVSNVLQMNKKISIILDKITVQRDLCFLVKFKYVINLKLYNKDNFPLDININSSETSISNPPEVTKNINDRQNKNKISSKNVTIYDCLNLFHKEEKLEKDNTWYCAYCKKHQEASKKLEIYRAPYYLIIQLKRFKIKSQSSFVDAVVNGKNESLVEYPLEALDLRDYIVGENKENAIYDLFGISQHFGNLSSGHYTSLCKNKGLWMEFDDETINQADEKNVVNNFAYLLFYKRRNNNNPA